MVSGYHGKVSDYLQQIQGLHINMSIRLKNKSDSFGVRPFVLSPTTYALCLKKSFSTYSNQIHNRYHY